VIPYKDIILQHYTKLLLIIGLLLTFSVVGATDAVFYKDISSKNAHTIISNLSANSKLSILDVRTTGEYQVSHIEQSQNIDFYKEDFSERLAQLDKEQTYLIYCRSGNRSGKTLTLMKKLGFKRVYNMRGGIGLWHKQNLPLKVK
jgi:rhodanese-related sulfurtransferase